MTVPLFDLPGCDTPVDGAERAPAREVTFLHTADWQLGMSRHYLDSAAAHAYTAARLEAVDRIGELAGEVGAEFVVVCGDVFEDHRVSSKIIRRTLDSLARFAMPVFLLPGNHDPYDPSGIYRSATFGRACPSNVTVLSRTGVHRVREGVELIAAPWSHKHPGRDLVGRQVAGLATGDNIRIVVGHGGTDALSPGSDPALIEMAGLENALVAGTIDYVALGDRHSVTSVGTTGRVWYPGAHEVTNFDHIEQRPGHVLEVSLSRGGGGRRIDVTEHRVGQWSFRSITRDIGSSADIEALRDELDAIEDKPRVVVQLGLVGSVSVTDAAALEELIDDSADRFAAITRWDRTDDLMIVADEADIADLGVVGYARTAAEHLLELSASDDPTQAGVASDALGLLRRLSGNRR